MSYELREDEECPGLDLFNTRAFQRLHETPRAACFTLRADGEPVAGAAFSQAEEGVWRSPLRGSYGGFQFALGARLDLAASRALIAGVRERLRARRLELTLPPMVYRPQEIACWLNELFLQGFTVSRHELSCAIAIGAPFRDQLDSGNRKRLARCEREGLAFRELEAGGHREAYEVVAQNRRERGFPITMTWPELSRMFETFPGRVRSFTVSRGARAIAAAVCMAVNQRVLYVFYWGELGEARGLSPVTFLAAQLYALCQREQFELLDLGTSTEHGEPNAGLIRYKRALGATESIKLWLSRGSE